MKLPELKRRFKNRYVIRIAAGVLTIAVAGGSAGVYTVNAAKTSTKAETTQESTDKKDKKDNKDDEEDLKEVLSSKISKAADEEVGKEETVYVVADNSGKAKDVIVSDWLKNFSGEAKIKDATDLTDVENVKGNETYKRGKKDSITWNANGKDIYYQGTSDKNLPVSMKVTYYLDGKEISPKKLVGKSGKVKIRYEYENHSAVTKTINGKQTTVYTPFTMISAAILNTDNFSNVKATNGKVISDGNKHIVIGVAMPGLADSLNLKNTSIGSIFKIPEDFEITADVEDFQMTVTATVANSDTLSEFGLDDAGDLSELTDSLKDLENATDKLCDGSGDLVKGIEKLVTASGKLKSGTNFSDIFSGILDIFSL